MQCLDYYLYNKSLQNYLTVSVFSVNWEQLRTHLLEKYQIEPSPAGLLIELHYWPCLDYCAGLVTHESIWIEAHEQYQKQSYRNRCYVLTANKVDCLTVPVIGQTHHQPIRDVRIDTGQHWRDRHWRCLQAAYNKAPFFEYYGPDVEALLQKSWTFLFDLNWEVLTICRKWLGLKQAIHLTDWYQKQPEIGIFDARSQLNAKKPSNTPVFCHPKAYSQNFGLDFVPNLSILDLLFCHGPEAKRYLISD